MQNIKEIKNRNMDRYDSVLIKSGNNKSLLDIKENKII